MLAYIKSFMKGTGFYMSKRKRNLKSISKDRKTAFKLNSSQRKARRNRNKSSSMQSRAIAAVVVSSLVIAMVIFVLTPKSVVSKTVKLASVQEESLDFRVKKRRAVVRAEPVPEPVVEPVPEPVVELEILRPGGNAVVNSYEAVTKKENSSAEGSVVKKLRKLPPILLVKEESFRLELSSMKRHEMSASDKTQLDLLNNKYNL